MEVSPYIHPPFKIATSRSNGLGVKNVVELCTPDVSRSTRVFVVEFRCQFQSEDFGGRLPGIVFAAIGPIHLSTMKGPSRQYESFCEGCIVRMSDASRKTLSPGLNTGAGVLLQS